MRYGKQKNLFDSAGSDIITYTNAFYMYAHTQKLPSKLLIGLH